MRTSNSRRTMRWVTPMLLVLLCEPALSQTSFGASSPSQHAKPGSPWQLAARKYDVDEIDLYAIAFQESRRRRADGRYRAWPWTLNSRTTGPLFFETYEAAAQKLESIIAAGDTSVDIGLMGVNWLFNGHRASDPASLLLPAKNIPVGAQIYREHLDRLGGDRRLALARYHSRRKARGVPYAASVLAIVEYLRGATDVQLALGN